jgi:hypothetical protein
MMKRIQIAALILLSNLFAFSGSYLYHEPPLDVRVGQDLILSAMPVSDNQVVEAQGYYRIKGNISFQEVHLQNVQATWEMKINGRALSEKGLEYCLIFKMTDGGILAFPKEDPLDQPHELNVLPMIFSNKIVDLLEPTFQQESVEVDILILSPEPDAEINPDDAVIALSLFNIPDVDSASIRLVVDGKDVTEQAEISGGIVTYIPKRFKKGIHSVQLTLSMLDGTPIKPISWTFSVLGGLAIAGNVDYRGDISARYLNEYVGENFLNVGELRGNAEVSVDFGKVKTSFRQTTRDNPYRQPLNRFSTALQFGEFLDIRMGDFYRSISPYTLDGRRVRGLSIDIDLKFVRLEVIQGQLNRKVQHLNKMNGALLLPSNPGKVDTLGQLLFTMDRTGYTFDREITLARLSIDLFSKFQMGVHIMKAKDDINSVNKDISGASFSVDSTDITVNDSLYNIAVDNYTYNTFTSAVEAVGGNVNLPNKNWGGRTPEDNIVVGFDIGTVRDKKRLKLDFSWNFSMHNRDIWDGPMTFSQLDTIIDDTADGFIAQSYDADGNVSTAGIDTTQIPFDPSSFQNLFIYNINTTPLVPFDYISAKFFPITTYVNMPSSAFHFRIMGNYRYSKFTMVYRQIGPEFVSLANPYLTTNIREFVFTNRLALIENKLLISATYKYKDDKILFIVKEPLKTKTLVASLTFMPGANAPSFVVNFQTIGKNNSKTELEKIGQEWQDFRQDSRTNNSFFSVTYPFSMGRIKHNLNVNVNKIVNEDQLAGDRKTDYFFQKSDSKTMSLALSSHFSIPLRTIANFSRTSIQVPVQDIDGNISANELVWTSISGNGHYSFFNYKLKVNAGLTYLTNKGTTPISLYGFKSGADYTIINGMTASLSGHVQMRDVNSGFSLNTSGFLFSFRYNF